jgi:hypothetical protein
MRQITNYNLVLLSLFTLALSACGYSNTLSQPINPNPSQPAVQEAAAASAGPTQSLQYQSTMVKLTSIRGEQVMIEILAVVQSPQGDWLLKITGQLPTPCHKLQWEHQVENRDLNFTIISTQEPDSMCAQVIQNFEQTIPIPDLPAGVYNVYINGVLIGEISI